MKSNSRTIADRRIRAALLLLVASPLLSGCVQRRLLIRSDPPGAVVYVDNERIGTTPCAVNYVYYGTRKIRLIKDGFETLEVRQPIPTPWYEVPPLDFVSDVVVPYEIRDVRSVTYKLAPQYIVPKDELLARAEELRRNSLAGTLPTPGILTGPVRNLDAETLPPSGQPIDADALVPFSTLPDMPSSPSTSTDPWPGAQTLPEGGVEYPLSQH